MGNQRKKVGEPSEIFLDGIEIKPGVNTSKLDLRILKACQVVKDTFKRYGLTPRLTSTFEYVEGRLDNSFHYEHLAVDFGVWVYLDGKRYNIPRTILVDIVKDIDIRLGYGYDVVLKSNHIHIERDIRNYPDIEHPSEK